MVDAYFVGIAILTIGASVLALESKELIYGAIALAISMLGIAGFFLLLDFRVLQPRDGWRSDCLSAPFLVYIPSGGIHILAASCGYAI